MVNRLGEAIQLTPPGLAAHWTALPLNDGVQSYREVALTEPLMNSGKVGSRPRYQGSAPCQSIGLGRRAEVMDG